MPGDNPLKVMIVDDDEVQLTVLRRWLEYDGYEVSVRSTAFGTSTAVLREQPDIVILDLEMPGLNGDSVAKLLGNLATSKRMGIVFYSANDPPDMDELARAAPVLGAIRKTTNSDVFRSTFKRLVARFLRRSDASS